MKKASVVIAFLSIMLVFVQFQANAQVGNTFENSFIKVYGTVGATFPYTDVQTTEVGYTAGVGLAFTPLAYIEIAADIQKGLLQEGHKTTSPLGGAQYKNDFINTTVVLRAMPIKLLGSQHQLLRDYLNISVGGGIALIKSDVKAKDLPINGIGSVGNYNKIDILFPIEFSYTLPIYTSSKGRGVFFGINYRYYYSNTDYLDG